MDNRLISEHIRELRKLRGLTQEKLADKSNLSINMISSIETTGRNISIDTLSKLANGLDTSLYDIISPFDTSPYAHLIEQLSKKSNKDDYIALFLHILNLK